MASKPIDIDLRDFDELAADLEKAKKKALPFAMRDALNTSAFVGRFAWQGAMRENMILRNRFTENSVRVEKARGLQVNRMEAVLGSTAPYMRTQEFGGIDFGSVPTEFASGESSLPRKKLVRKPNRMQQIRLARRPKKGGSLRQRNAAAIAQARKQGKRFVYLETQRSKGIYRVSGGKRSIKVRPIWNTAKKVHRIKPNPTLQPALRVVNRDTGRIYKQAIIKQLRFHRILGF